MIGRLPRWVWIGAPLLAAIAGMINAVGFLSFTHQGVTHLTGTTTLFGLALGESRWRDATHLGGMVAAFVAGGALSGIIIRESTLQLGRRYGVALVIESLLLCSAVSLLHRGNALGDYLASSACGLQNAMVSTYSGAVLRTTHVSGMFTDIGIAFGHLLRGITPDWAKFRLWSAMIVAFAAGGTAGALAFPRLGYGTLYIPAAVTAATGVIYGLYRHCLHVPAEQLSGPKPPV